MESWQWPIDYNTTKLQKETEAPLPNTHKV